MIKFFVISIFALIAQSSALMCWTCENVRTNEECLDRGELRLCQVNENSCFNQIRVDNIGIRIEKRCKQAEACDNNFIQNPRPAFIPTQCNPKVRHTVCRCCCHTDACNRDELFCLDLDPECLALGNPANGRTDCVFEDSETEVGSFCSFTCNPGFQLVGDESSECVLVGDSAAFSNGLPSCQPMVCRPPQSNPTNGEVECSDANNVNSDCSFSCEDGFFLDGSTNVVCLPNGQWSDSPPRCVRIVCEPPHTAPSNGGVSCTDRNNENSECTFSCSFGFELVGNSVSVCRDDSDNDALGLWSAPAPTCRAIPCPLRPAPDNGQDICSNGVLLDSECTYVCDPGFFLSGSVEATCLIGGIWSDDVPTCVRITCEPPHVAPENGGVDCTDANNENSDCSFTCDLGFELIGSVDSTCVDDSDNDALGEWTSEAPTCRQIDCPVRPEPDNGSVDCTNGELFNSECTYVCDPGFFLSGSVEATCLIDGTWSDDVPTCVRITCEPPHVAPENGGVDCTDANNENSECSFICNLGFELIGSVDSTCVDDSDNDALGEWTSEAPTCRQIVCPERGPPANGDVDCTNGVLFNSECTYVCDPGFFLSGSVEATCLIDGTWSDDVPTCVRITCEPPHVAPENGGVDCTDANNENSECSFACDLGFELVGSPESTCIDDSDNDALGEWTSLAPTCRIIECPPRGPPENGADDCSNGDLFDSLCDYTCDPGYFLDGSIEAVCMVDGTWSEDVPTCVRITCQPLQVAPQNGAVDCTDANNENSECTFTCNPGFELDGSPDVTCVDDLDNDALGEWTSDAPICREIVCPERDPPANGNVNCTDGVALNSECTYVCDPGFVLFGSSSATCLADETWSEDVPTCVALRCIPPRREPIDGTFNCTNENFLGSVCSFACNLGFELIGDQQNTCEDDFLNDDDLGDWSSRAPSCRAIVCSERRDPINGDQNCTDTEFFDSVCTFECDPGFALLGDDSSRCQLDGLWSTEVPFCDQITCLPEYTTFTNGDVDCTNSNFVGSECTFTCTDRFFVAGSDVLTCLEINERGDWSDPEPICQLKMCDDPPPAPDNGFLVCTDDNLLGSQCEYGCEGFHTRVGPLYSNCVELEDGTLVWDNPAPVCERTECPVQGPLEHGEITCSDDYFAESDCQFECVDPGYELFPPTVDENTCLNDTTWSVPEPCCTRPCPPFAEFDAVFILDSSSSVGDENWLRMTNFTRDLLESFNLGNDLARMAVFRYNRVVDTETQILLNEFTAPDERDALIAAFDEIPYDGSGTRTGRALQHALNVVLAPENGNRPDVDDVVILITDGRSQDNVGPVSARLRARGVTVFALGILPPGSAVGREQLLEIVGDPDNLVFVEGGFSGLDQDFLLRIGSQICGDPCDG